ncbi:unnamed protein product [Enterobius vermicularis]|uniref:RING-type domain-containing protein n=1 Tax=Enterobius vermicularis TaxID=51028 RepID=A0A0N4UY02_ENTVE|nr:unnamed protein product [Enterobius vermicularis]
MASVEIQCTVCYKDFKTGDAGADIAALPCGHTFHRKCIRDWLRASFPTIQLNYIHLNFERRFTRLLFIVTRGVNGKICPYCRAAVRENEIIEKLYFIGRKNEANGAREVNVQVLHCHLM